MIKKQITKKVLEGILIASLIESNYECVQEGDYIKAFSINDTNKNLFIYSACRCLSENETYIVNISSNIINKLELKTEQFAEEFIPCIAFCIGEYSYLNSKITIVPTSSWKNSSRGYVFSISNGKHYYNPSKATDNNNFLLQAQWNGDLK